METLGIAGLSTHPVEVTHEYNKLLKLVGIEGMLIAFERWADTDNLNDLIKFLNDNLQEYTMKNKPTWDELYNYIDSLAIEGDINAQNLISEGYKSTYDTLYDFVDSKMVEGDDIATDLINQ